MIMQQQQKSTADRPSDRPADDDEFTIASARLPRCCGSRITHRTHSKVERASTFSASQTFRPTTRMQTASFLSCVPRRLNGGGGLLLGVLEGVREQFVLSLSFRSDKQLRNICETLQCSQFVVVAGVLLSFSSNDVPRIG